jgi:high affinity sulfate transporter 1
MTTPTAARATWRSWLPGVALLATYERRWLRDDVVAGLVLTALMVPAGLGYAAASGLDPIHGLYASVVPLVVYALVGPSRVLVLGPDSSLAPLVLAAVVTLADDPAEAVAVAGMLAVATGVLCALAGVARFGFLTDLLSKPVRYGYLNGIALTVVVTQLPKLLGFSGGADNVVDGVQVLVDGLQAGEAQAAAAAVGLVTLTVILVLRAVAPRVPGPLVAVVGAIAAVVLLDLDDDLPLVGDLPRGLPSLVWPGVEAADLVPIAAAALGIAFVSFADTSVLSRTWALRAGQDVDPNRELVALGAANVATGLFQGFPISSSASRTPVAAAAGARTQLTGIVCAAAIVALLVAFPGLFRNLAEAALAAIVISAVLTLVEVRGVAHLLPGRRGELVLSMATFAAVAVLGVLAGIGVAVGLSLLHFVQKAWRPHATELVRVDGVKGYHDRERHPEGRTVPGLVLYRFDAPLFFANAEHFRVEVVHLAERPGTRRIVVTAEPITDVDATAAESLSLLADDLAERGVTLAFAELKGHVREKLARDGLVARLGEQRFHRTIGEAVKAYVADEGASWVDWEDAGAPPGPPEVPPSTA